MKATKQWGINEYSIGDLFLDQNNIRLPITGKAQNAIIQDLFSNEDAFELVKSLSQNGLFPDEFPILIKEKGKYIVIEGNRRLAALKALFEPNLVPAFKTKIQALPNPKIRKINAVLAPNRAAAVKHIANKHTINLRRAWKPLRQAYFYKSQLDNGVKIEELIKTFPEHDVPKFIRMLEMHHLAKSIHYADPLVLTRVHDELRFPITNLERLYDNPHVQAFLGISFDEQGKVKGKVPAAEFSKGFRKLVEDVALGQVDSRKMNTSKHIEAYIKALPKEVHPNLKAAGKFGARDVKENKVDVAVAKKLRARRTATLLFLPSAVPFKTNSTALRILYDELHTIDIERFPNATHDFLRTFLECALMHGLKERKEYDGLVKNPSHIPGISEMLAYVGSDACKWIKDHNVKQVVQQMKSDYSKPYSLARMHMANHNENMVSVPKDVQAAWAKMEKLVKTLIA